METSKLIEAQNLLGDLLNEHDVDDGHGIKHALSVVDHAKKALMHDTHSKDIKEAILLASLLHDADDRKFFPDNKTHQNARHILSEIGAEDDLADLVVDMIDLVSCSSNGNTPHEPMWMLIPRFADRLEAIGKIGIVRCWQYSKHKNMKMFTSETPRATSLKELLDIASPERFAGYKGTSESMMDHFYDKLLHLHKIQTKNAYLKCEAKQRHSIIVDFCLDFGKNGTIDEGQLRQWEKELSS